MKKKFLILIISVIIMATATLFVCCDNDTNDYSDVDYSQWMKNLSNDAVLNQIAMPGSHDAGSVGMISFAETQSTDILTQLKHGVRYFDLRVTKVGDQLLIFHGPITKMSFSKVLSDIQTFFETNDTEIVILDFQHFEKQSQNEVAQLLKSQLQADKYAVPSNINPQQLTMGEIREKGYRYFITWNSNITQQSKPYLHYRSNTLLSYYDSDEHKQSAKDIFEQVWTRDYKLNSTDKIFVLQAVATAQTVQTPNKLAKAINPYLSQFVDLINQNSDYLSKTNVLMFDYCSDYLPLVLKIININVAKGYMTAVAHYQ